MIAEIRQADGFKKRHLVKIQDNGKTVEVNNVTYVLPREKEEEEAATESEAEDDLGDRRRLKDWRDRHPEGNAGGERPRFPTKQFVKWPLLNVLGWSPFYTILRIEEWQEDNPEPIRPYDGELFATGAEFTAIKNEAQATAAAVMAMEAEAMQKTMIRAIKNMPSKMIVYLGLIATAGIGVIILIILFGIKVAVGG
jgi:hypothetical protein